MVSDGHIPVFIVEEHHEAFFIWSYSYFNGLINPFGNTLLHVDSHEDMVIARLKSSIDDLDDNLGEIYDYVYAELGIASFIVPAIYRGLINSCVLMCRHDSYTGNRTERYVASYKSQGRFFKTDVVSPLLRAQLKREEGQEWGRHQFYSYQEIGIGGSFESVQPVILDIDLDYFSCDNSLSSADTRVEITRDAYQQFLESRYHPFKVMPAAALGVEQEGDRYYMRYSEWQEEPSLKKVGLDVIDRRIERFIEFLKKNGVKPSIIDICRSRFSGYTPKDQWEYIEKRLIEGLKGIYDIKISSIYEFEGIYGRTR